MASESQTKEGFYVPISGAVACNHDKVIMTTYYEKNKQNCL